MTRRLSTTLHRAALRAYPTSFRDRLGADLQRTFEARLAVAGRAAAVVALAGIADTLVSGAAERLADRRERARHARFSSTASPSRSLLMSRESLVADVRLAVRQMRRAPLFAAMTIATLALGIGANSAIFSAVYAVLLRPLPYDRPGQLVAIWSDQTRLGDSNYPVSPANFAAFQREAPGLANVEAMYSFLTNPQVRLGDSTEVVQSSSVTAGLFRLLGRRAMLGRVLQEGDDNAALLSYSYWQRRFNGDLNVVGQTLIAVGAPRPVTIVGVMPQDFVFPYRSMLGPSGFSRANTADVWQLIPMTSGRMVDNTGQPARTIHYLSVVGRLAPGASIEQARAGLQAIAARRVTEFPDTNQHFGVTVRSLHEQTVGSIRPALLVLVAGVAVLLLMTCINVANVLLARATGQHRDLAVRSALGASRARLLQQTMVESTVLALGGGLAALFVVVAGGEALVALAPAGLARLDEARPSLAGGAFTLGLSLLTGVLVGLLPGAASARVRPDEGLRESKRTTATAAQRAVRSTLVVAEVTLATLLTIGAGLLLRSFVAVLSVHPGFEPSHLLTFQVSMPTRHVAPQARIGFYEDLMSALSAIPGVTKVGGSTRIPLGSTRVSTLLTVEHRDVAASELPEVEMRRAVGDYFNTMSMPIVQGRVFTPEDRTNQEGIVVINAALATKVFPNQQAVGQRVRMGSDATSPWLRVIGVVGSIRHASLEETPRPEIYISHYQGPPTGPFMAVRTTGDPAALTPAVRAAVVGLGADPPTSVRTMDDLRSDSVGERRFVLLLVGAFGVLALVLAAIGVYGVIALVVSERTAEVGVRLALGATPRQVLSLLVSQALRLGAIGVGLGAGLGLLVAPIGASMLFAIKPADPLTFIGISTVMLAVAAAASVIPARRAMNVDPASALRAS